VTDEPTAWKPLIDEWVRRESRLHPDSPIKDGSVRVRDAVEVEDQAFVLVSFDVDHPWPDEEDAPGGRSENTAVLQAARVRQPWIERDAVRSLSRWVSADGEAAVFEHPLGRRRAFSGAVPADWTEVRVQFAGDDPEHSATVVDGWFLAIVPDDRRLESITGVAPGGETVIRLERDDMAELLTGGIGAAARSTRSMYFSPLDLRTVHAVLQWERVEGGVVVVATSLEQYDDGGVLRLRVDGVRVDDDTFVTWPTITVERGNQVLSSAVCGEYGQADTLSIDLGIRPWVGDDGPITVTVRGLRGASGPVEPVRMELEPRASRRG
jgi:hypothetical protein